MIDSPIFSALLLMACWPSQAMENERNLIVNSRKRKFVEAFTENATEAARLAGSRSPEVQGCRLLRNVHVLTATRQRENFEAKGLIANREERQEFWARMIRDTTIDIGARLRASKLLGKSQSDFIDRRQHVGSPFTLQLIYPEPRDVGEDKGSAGSMEIAAPL